MKDRTRPPHTSACRLTDRLGRWVVPFALLLWAAGAHGEPCPEDVDGELVGHLRGALEADLDWRHGPHLECQGMQRPDDPGDEAAPGGGRLWFRGRLAEGQSLIVVIGIDGLAAGVTGDEFEANLTLVVEHEGWFFSSRGQTGCWADVNLNEALKRGGHRVGGTLYCLRGIGQIGDSRAVSVPELRFRGWLKPGEDPDQQPEAVTGT